MSSNKQTLKVERPKNPFARDIQIAFRSNAEEKDFLQKMADKYTDGNISEYVRYASLKLESFMKKK